MSGSKTLGLVAVGIVVLIAGRGLAKSHDGEHGHGHGHGDDAHAHGGGGPVGGGSQGGGAPGAGGPHVGGGACDPAALAAVDAALAAACPCAGLDDGAGATTPWRNHGQYVRCVAHAVHDAARGAGLKRRCVRDLVPCAARSTCGKDGAVTCIVPLAGTCVGGTCSNAPEVPCTLDAECVTTACSVTTADSCTASGGAAATGSCCTASPSGAFVEAPAGQRSSGSRRLRARPREEGLAARGLASSPDELLQGADMSPEGTSLAARLGRIADRSTCRLTHHGRRSGKPYEVTIWFMVDGDTVYLASANAARQWVRNVERDGRVAIAVGGERLSGRAERLRDPPAERHVMDLVAAKYWYVRPVVAIGRLLGFDPTADASFRVEIDEARTA
jgi:deazaflavin-dependent oxidoreductase (nitroreductase family)